MSQSTPTEGACNIEEMEDLSSSGPVQLDSSTTTSPVDASTQCCVGARFVITRSVSTQTPGLEVSTPIPVKTFTDVGIQVEIINESTDGGMPGPPGNSILGILTLAVELNQPLLYPKTVPSLILLVVQMTLIQQLLIITKLTRGEEILKITITLKVNGTNLHCLNKSTHQMRIVQVIHHHLLWLWMTIMTRNTSMK